MQSKLFYLCIISFILGVASRSFFDFGQNFVLLLLLVSLVVVFIDKKFVIFSICLVLFSLGFLRLDFALSKDYVLSDLVNSQISEEVVISDEPRRSENSTQLIVSTENSKEKILIITEKASIFEYGDRLLIKGLLQKPENFITDNNREFDYINYLAKDSIYYQMFFPEIEIISSGEGGFLKRKLFQLKHFLISKMSTVIPSPEAEYASGLIFGAKESLGSELEESFRKTGLIHVVVLSGYNVTIIAKSILKVFSLLPVYIGFSLSILSIILFALMTGAGATIVRASIMAILVIVGDALGRRYDINRSLFIAGFLMVLHNPNILLHDPSFQLSFLATLGLVNLSPFLQEKLKFIPERFNIRELFSITIATQIFVLPLLLNKIGELSLIAPVTNLLVLPAIPITMFFGFLTSVVGIISNTLSFVPGFISYVLLFYQIKIVEIFANLPFASILIKSFPFWAMLLAYGLYLFFMGSLRK